jgi:UPF0042 nucleotide-binding protein
VVVVTGMSGAGRSTALNVLEDLGFFCVDNLPPALAVKLVEMLAAEDAITRVGLGIDVRTGSFLEGADAAFKELEASGHNVEVLFMDSADGALVQRYSETRRPHPLAPGGDLLEAIQKERDRLSTLRARAKQVIDTTRLSVHDLRRLLVDSIARGDAAPRMVTRIVSFGFKYGIPVDADLVFDLRYLPNPHFVPELKPLTGMDARVSRFVLDAPETKELLTDLESMLTRLLPRYEREGKAYLTIAVGCTGGKHRSVAVAEELARRLRPVREVAVAHRDSTR